MKNYIYLLVIILNVSCKTSYTGFNAVHFNNEEIFTIKTPANLEIKTLEVENTSPVFEASTNGSSTISKNNTFNSNEKSLIEHREVITKNNGYIYKKATVKEKLVTKMIQKKMKKVVANPTQPDGFNSLDGKLKIGIILLLVAIGLSILGLGGIGGLAALIGLVFVVLGLINMYG
jgi:hypothetical protein